MINITKIVNKNNKIEIHHSNNVIDKRINYDIQFDSVYKGYTDYYISKEVVQSKKPQFSQLKCTLYLSTKNMKKIRRNGLKFSKNLMQKNTANINGIKS